jgi:hypothetical protein
MYVSIIGTTSDNSITSTTSTTSCVHKNDVVYINSKEDFEYEDNEAFNRYEKEWIMTGWNNPRKINIPKFNVILQNRK